jgi:flagellar hook-associated protein 1 FlgK
MSDFSIGLSALLASRRAQDIVGQNIANANTPGYHRQVPNFSVRSPAPFGNLSIGTGVQITDIRRLRDQLVETALTQNTFQLNNTTTQLTTLRQIETDLAPGSGSLDSLLSAFFNQRDQLTANPDDLAQRRVFLGSASALANKFNTVSSDFAQLRDGVDSQLKQLVGQANSLISQIADLNQQIQRVQVKGINDNDQLDQRDQLISQLSQLVDVRVTELGDGQATVVAAGIPVVVANQAMGLQFSMDKNGNAILTAAGSTTALPVQGGQAAGLLQIRNQSLPDFTGRLDALAHTFAQQLNPLQATGLGLGGPLSFAAGSQAASSVTVPLTQAKLAFPPQAGSLFISVTNKATGDRTIHEVKIDPATQSLQDVANAISAVPNLQGLVDPQTGTLKVLAAAGYSFDFAGRLASQPDTLTITGTTRPQANGTYTGSANDIYTYKVIGTGTVGVTPNLTLQVTNSANVTVASLNIGQGYEPGSALQIGNGLTVQLSAGTANDGDNFTTQVIANPDTAGLLTALGLNTFFTGSNAGNLAVQPNLLSDPAQLAASRSGQPGDSTNLQRMVALRDAKLLANGSQTLAQFYGSMVSNVGTGVQQLSQQQSAQQALGQQLLAQQQAVSGVDTNEELLLLTQYQQSFEIASRYIATINTTLESLFQIISA